MRKAPVGKTNYRRVLEITSPEAMDAIAGIRGGYSELAELLTAHEDGLAAQAVIGHVWKANDSLVEAISAPNRQIEVRLNPKNGKHMQMHETLRVLGIMYDRLRRALPPSMSKEKRRILARHLQGMFSEFRRDAGYAPKGK
ncbi:MAG: hypothetical protein V1881_02230 [Candidatus Micrarchaeota archaeon]